MDQSTEQIILRAAAEQFAAKGFDGARVDEIAAAAGVNKATLYYQIGDKAALYGRVLSDMLSRTADRISAAVAAAPDPEQKVRAYCREFAASAQELHHLAPIMMREVAGGGTQVPDTALAQFARIVKALDEGVNMGMASGVFRQVNPFVAHMLVVGGLSFFNAGTPLRTRIAESQGVDIRPRLELDHEQMTEQLSALIVGALKNA
ncbi:MAG TPA: TetR/AcrR family transcriptional regulator [Gammaproteobacteria bacterium]